ncbi:MAG TPA: four helix bundle protein [Firmicutes bacterium]|nr:four helix bundle protein [Bacillota bacterium]
MERGAETGKMDNFREDMLKKTQGLGLKAVKIASEIPDTAAGRYAGEQLVRLAASVGIVYRTASRGKPKDEYLSDLKTVVENTDTTKFWLELIKESGLYSSAKLDELMKESGIIAAIFVKTLKSMREKERKNQ